VARECLFAFPGDASYLQRAAYGGQIALSQPSLEVFPPSPTHHPTSPPPTKILLPVTENCKCGVDLHQNSRPGTLPRRRWRGTRQGEPRRRRGSLRMIPMTKIDRSNLRATSTRCVSQVLLLAHMHLQLQLQVQVQVQVIHAKFSRKFLLRVRRR
jgi:hypothetical protein